MADPYQQFFKQARHAAKTTPGVHPRIKLKKAAGEREDLLSRSQQAAGQSRESQSRFSEGNSKTAPKTRVEELRHRLREKKHKARRKPSWAAMAVAVLGLGLTAAALLHTSEIEKFSQRIEVSLMGAAQAEEAPKKDAPKTTEKVAGAKAGDDKVSDPSEATKKDYSPEEINHFAKLNERQHELDAREAELNRMETELAKQKEELQTRLKELESTRRQIASVLEDRVQADDKKVEGLVQIYSNMKPQQAAKIFETMDEDLAIEILGRMKKKPASEILNLVKAEKAQVLSEKYAGYKKK